MELRRPMVYANEKFKKYCKIAKREVVVMCDPLTVYGSSQKIWPVMGVFKLLAFARLAGEKWLTCISLTIKLASFHTFTGHFYFIIFACLYCLPVFSSF